MSHGAKLLVAVGQEEGGERICSACSSDGVAGVLSEMTAEFQQQLLGTCSAGAVQIAEGKPREVEIARALMVGKVVSLLIEDMETYCLGLDRFAPELAGKVREIFGISREVKPKVQDTALQDTVGRVVSGEAWLHSGPEGRA